MRNLHLVAVLAFAAILIGCDNEPLPANTDTASSNQMVYSIMVDRTENGEFTATLPDGIAYHDLSTYQNQIAEITKVQTAKGYQVQVYFGPNIAHQLEEALGPAPPAADTSIVPGFKTFPLQLAVGSYYLSTGPTTYGKAYGGCISGFTDIEYSIRLNRGNPGVQIFDLHLAKFTRGGRPCFGAYESVYRYVNSCTCSPVSYEQVKSAIYSAALAVGTGATIAGLIAEVGTPVAVGALAL